MPEISPIEVGIFFGPGVFMGGHRDDQDFGAVADYPLFIPMEEEVEVRLDDMEGLKLNEVGDLEVEISIEEDEEGETSAEVVEEKDFAAHTRPTKEYPCAAALYWLIDQSKYEEPVAEGNCDG